jgi:hypothetical protein
VWCLLAVSFPCTYLHVWNVHVFCLLHLIDLPSHTLLDSKTAATSQAWCTGNEWNVTRICKLVVLAAIGLPVQHGMQGCTVDAIRSQVHYQTITAAHKKSIRTIYIQRMQKTLTTSQLRETPPGYILCWTCLRASNRSWSGLSCTIMYSNWKVSNSLYADGVHKHPWQPDTHFDSHWPWK